jgi:ribonuclease HI
MSSKAKKKYYVVWRGIKPGIYDSWDDCKKQVQGFEGA